MIICSSYIIEDEKLLVDSEFKKNVLSSFEAEEKCQNKTYFQFWQPHAFFLNFLSAWTLQLLARFLKKYLKSAKVVNFLNLIFINFVYFPWT